MNNVCVGSLSPTVAPGRLSKKILAARDAERRGTMADRPVGRPRSMSAPSLGTASTQLRQEVGTVLLDGACYPGVLNVEGE